MAVNDEMYRLILETVGTDGVKILRDTLDSTKGSLAGLKAQYAQGEISQGEYFRGVQNLSRE